MGKGQELAQRVYTQITEHPETHDQNRYRMCACIECGGRGVGMCVAGWAVEFGGFDSEMGGVLVLREAFGLSTDEAEDLYAASNTQAVQTMRELAEAA